MSTTARSAAGATENNDAANASAPEIEVPFSTTTGIAFDVPPGSYLNGTPAIPYMLERRLQILHQRLPDLFKRVEALEKKAE